MRQARTVLVLALSGTLAVAAPAGALARGGHGPRIGHAHSSASPGTGSNPSAHNVRGYTRKDGTYVAPHRQSNPNNTTRDNWSTRGNRNPDTG